MTVLLCQDFLEASFSSDRPCLKQWFSFCRNKVIQFLFMLPVLYVHLCFATSLKFLSVRLVQDCYVTCFGNRRYFAYLSLVDLFFDQLQEVVLSDHLYVIYFGQHETLCVSYWVGWVSHAEVDGITKHGCMIPVFHWVIQTVTSCRRSWVEASMLLQFNSVFFQESAFRAC